MGPVFRFDVLAVKNEPAVVAGAVQCTGQKLAPQAIGVFSTKAVAVFQFDVPRATLPGR